MLRLNSLKVPVLAFALALLLGCPTWAASAIRDFTFIHISDEHSNAGPSTSKTIADLQGNQPIFLEPYNVTADAPSFVIETGDMTEFGPIDGAWDILAEWYEETNLPRYHSLGNHDGTWHSLTPELTKLYGAPYYSFDKFGCHFVVLDSAGLQDPRPVFSPEELEWLKGDLAKVGTERPVFVAYHHPASIGEFSSAYEGDRLMDILRPYNIVLLMVGHGHSAQHGMHSQYDEVEGGSAYGPNPGFMVISVKDGILRAAYKEQGKAAATKALLEKPLAPPAERYPAISIQSPKNRFSYTEDIPVKAWVRMKAENVQRAYYEIDGAIKGDLARQPDGSYAGVIKTADLAAGAHFTKVCFARDKDTVYHHLASFYVETGKPKVAWRTYLASASKSIPAVDKGTLYIGTNNGYLNAYNVNTGKLKWKYKTGGAVTAEPLIQNGNIIFGSEDGNLYCLSAKGKLVWKFTADDAIYCSAVSDGPSVYVGDASGGFYSVSAATGKLNWKNTDATYTIERKPSLANGRVYYGAWDTFVYCLNTADGKLVWKCVGQGSSEGVAPRYYSAADSCPVVADGNVYIADRKSKLSIIDGVTGKLKSNVDMVTGVALASDGKSIYVRRNKGALAKLDADGKEIWSVDVSMDDLPTEPIEYGGVVYVCSKRGLASAVAADTGKVLWQYWVAPSSFVLSGMGASGDKVFVAGTDGMLTVIER